MSKRDIKTVNSVADAYRSMYAKPIEINEDILNEELIDSLIEEVREEETVLSEGMSKPMTLKQYANKIGIDAKEKQWIMDNEKDVQVFHPNNKGRGWSVLSYPIRDNDYYFAFLTGESGLKQQYLSFLDELDLQFFTPRESHRREFDERYTGGDVGTFDTSLEARKSEAKTIDFAKLVEKA